MWSDLVAYLSKKRVLIWGLGEEGISSARFLSKHLPSQAFVISDGDPKKVQAALTSFPTATGLTEPENLDPLEEFDLILKSPGIPLTKYGGVHLGLKQRIRGQAELFLKFAPGITIGVTGTKGKSTTSSLIAHLLRQNGTPIPLVGNIGLPTWNVIEELDENSITVVELSSYQLDGVQHSPKIAVLLNLYQEHLNYHGNLDAYWTAKWNITRHQQPGNTLVYNALSKEIKSRLALLADGVRKVPFAQTPDLPPALTTSVCLRGRHNYLNVQAAVEVAKLFNLGEEGIRQRLGTFQGLPHRLEFLGVFREVIYYNDSISTVPESTMAALEALPETDTLIVGGQNRGVNYSSLAERLRRSNLKTIILVSETGKILHSLLPEETRTRWVSQLSEATDIAREKTPPGGTCLFSPAAPSYNQFKNFEERGNLFKKLVSQ